MSTDSADYGQPRYNISMCQASIEAWMRVLSDEMVEDVSETSMGMTVWWIRYNYAMLTMNIRWKLREAGNVRTPLGG